MSALRSKMKLGSGPERDTRLKLGLWLWLWPELSGGLWSDGQAQRLGPCNPFLRARRVGIAVGDDKVYPHPPDKGAR